MANYHSGHPWCRCEIIPIKPKMARWKRLLLGLVWAMIGLAIGWVLARGL